ncbi:Peroxisomal membrane protein PMP27 [Coemansia aciculifera]|uniref:Peroxisomal membrane protein PMP27 n=1 Tax=Coemansia aciculifera TaxID=417176 RepID=A0ACC1LYD9_9FUNG|nr:Peroxisomal membrane protein PMP27 [Coemansia aciculifera]KAJ2911057.1 Peroxisomal membrane protein PMP27 [Coemansia aciculifera]
MLLSIVAAAANSSATATYIKYASQLSGRDKACRFTQYFARLLAYLVTRRISLQGGKPQASTLDWLATLTKIQGTMSTTRKILRSGKFIDFFRLFVRSLYESGGDEVERLLNMGHKGGMFVFMLADTVGILHSALGLVRLRDPARVTRVAMRGWWCALACQLLAAAYQLRALMIREADVARVRRHLEKDADPMADRECVVEERLVAQRKRKAVRQVVAAALDISIPTAGLGLLGLNEGFVALAGSVTSLMGMQDILYSD